MPLDVSLQILHTLVNFQGSQLSWNSWNFTDVLKLSWN